MKAIDKIDPSLVVDFEVDQIHARAFCTNVDTPAPIIDCSVKQISTRFSNRSYSGRDYTEVAVRLRRMEMLLCAPSPALRLQGIEAAGTPGQPVGQVVCEGIEAGVASRLRHSQNTIRLNMCNTAIVTPAFDSIRDLVKAWQAAFASVPSSSDSVTPAAIVLYDAVRAAVEASRPVQQPPFMHASHYELHHMDHRSVRLDFGWSLLTRLRHWVHTLPKPPSVPIPNYALYTSMELAKIEVEGQSEGCSQEQMKRLIDDTRLYTRQQTFMTMAFGSEVTPDTSDQNTLLDHTTHLFANIGLFHLAHQGKMLESDRIVSSFVNIVSASTGLQYLLGQKHSRPTMRIRAVNAVKAIDVTIQNSIFNAIEPLLSLVPAREPGSGLEKPDCNRLDIIVMDNLIERAELEVIAAGLRMKGVLDQGSLNIHREDGGIMNETTSPIASRTTGNIMVSKMETVLSVITERVHSASLMPAGVVATWTTKDLGGVVSHVASEETGFSEDLKVLMSLRSFDLDIRPQMKALHDLINHVRQEDLPYVVHKRGRERHA